MATVIMGVGKRLGPPRFQGTMLPFAPGSSAGYSVLQSENLTTRGLSDHPSVETWVVRADGSVRLPKVGIFASNTKPRGDAPELLASIDCNDPFSGGIALTTLTKTGLLDWLYCFQEEVYAVCNMTTDLHIIGVILQRETNSGPFIKAGSFYTLSI
jgi:hypothetical protein